MANLYKVSRQITTWVTGELMADSDDEAVVMALRGEEVNWECDYNASVMDLQSGEIDVLYEHPGGDPLDIIKAVEYAKERGVDIYTCCVCGEGVKVGEPVESAPNGYRHTDDADCGKRHERTFRLDGFLPTSREVEFTDPDTGAVGYGLIEPHLAKSARITDMVGKTVSATGHEREVEWSFNLPEHPVGYVISEMAAL